LGNTNSPHLGYNRSAYPYTLPPNFMPPTMHENLDRTTGGAREDRREHAQGDVNSYPLFTTEGPAPNVLPQPNIVGVSQPCPMQPLLFSVGGSPLAVEGSEKLDLIEERLRSVKGFGDYPFVSDYPFASCPCRHLDTYLVEASASLTWYSSIHSTPPEFSSLCRKLFQLSSCPTKDVCTIVKGPYSYFGSSATSSRQQCQFWHDFQWGKKPSGKETSGVCPNPNVIWGPIVVTKQGRAIGRAWGNSGAFDRAMHGS